MTVLGLKSVKERACAKHSTSSFWRRFRNTDLADQPRRDAHAIAQAERRPALAATEHLRAAGPQRAAGAYQHVDQHGQLSPVLEQILVLVPEYQEANVPAEPIGRDSACAVG